jgi:hypothetical protein
VKRNGIFRARLVACGNSQVPGIDFSLLDWINFHVDGDHKKVSMKLQIVPMGTNELSRKLH